MLLTGITSLAQRIPSPFISQHLPQEMPAAARPSVADDVNWEAGFEQPGVELEVRALAVAPGGDVIVGGDFQEADGDPRAGYVSRWDGARWHPMGSILNRSVRTLVYGANGDLYAGGYFLGQSLNHIARWDGVSWQPLGTGLSNTVNAIVPLPNGDLVVAGNFQNAGGNPAADRIARWDGTAWHAIGSGLGNEVFALAALPNGDIVAGGAFLNAGGNPMADRIARWDGTAWQPFLGGVNAPVRTLVVSPAGELLMGGEFTNVGGDTLADYALRWTGTAWQPLCPGLNRQVMTLTFAANGDLLMGGDFVDAAGIPEADHIARWHGGQWQALGIGINPTPLALSVWNTGSVYAIAERPGGDLMAAGRFQRAGTYHSSYIAHWSGADWLPMGGNGHDNLMTGLEVTPAGDILASGTNFYGGMGQTPNIAGVVRWTGTRWEQFDSTMNGSVEAMTLAPNGDLLVSGELFLEGGSSSGYDVLRWNGQTWQPLGGRTGGTALMLAAAPNGDAYALFDGPQNNWHYLRRWNGSAWVQVGPPIPSFEVYALTVTPAGDVLLGGEFLNLGGNPGASYLVRWDGVAWQPVNPAITTWVTSIVAEPNGGLWVAANQGQIHHWNGASWQTLPRLVSGYGGGCWLKQAPNGTILVSGDFTNASGNPNADYIAWWDGSAWQPFGSGLNAWGGIAVRPNGDVVVLSSVNGFTRTGNGSKLMHHFAIYHASSLTALPDEAFPRAEESLFPNPAHSLVHLSGAAGTPVTLLDTQGRTVWQTQLPADGALPLQGLSKGLYLVRYGAQTRRLIVD